MLPGDVLKWASPDPAVPAQCTRYPVGVVPGGAVQVIGMEVASTPPEEPHETVGTAAGITAVTMTFAVLVVIHVAAVGWAAFTTTNAAVAASPATRAVASQRGALATIGLPV